MYSVSDAFLEAVQANTRSYYWAEKITTKDGTEYEFGYENILKGSGYISVQCCGSTEIELGTVYSAELGIALFLPMTWTEDGEAIAYVTYEYNDETITLLQPAETWHSGKHILTLYYPLDGVAASVASYFSVYRCFQAILEDREAPAVEKMVDGYTGFLFLDKDGMPEVVMHWEHRFRHMVNRYNDIYRVQMPVITPHVCRHTYCSNMARSGMNPKTLQYLMGHSDIGVTMNTYTHLGLEDAQEEMTRLQETEKARAEMERLNHSEEKVTKAVFRAG